MMGLLSQNWFYVSLKMTWQESASLWTQHLYLPHLPLRIYQLLSWNSFFWTWTQSWWEGKFRCSTSYSHTPRPQEAPLPLPLQMYFHLTSSQISGISLLGLSVLILWTDSIFEGVLPLRSCSFKDPQASTFLSERDRRPQNFSEEILFWLPYYSSVAFWLVHTYTVFSQCQY